MITAADLEEGATYETAEGTITVETIIVSNGMVVFREEEGIVTHNALKNLLPSLIRKVG